MRGDPQIVVPDHFSLAFQLRANRSIGFRRRFRQGEHRQQVSELFQSSQSIVALLVFRRAIEQLTKRNHGQCGLFLPKRVKAPQDFFRLLSPDVDTEVGVQQEMRLHQRPLRFCGLSFSRRGISKSSGSPASRSKARARFPRFSRRTISSPLREISSSLAFTRNCFGSRTAWLFPDLNTLAVSIVNLHPMYIRKVYTSSGQEAASFGFVVAAF